MAISDVGGVTSAMTADQANTSIATKVFKKALEIEEQNAMQLLQSLPQPVNPPNLGNAVDVKA